MNPYDILKVDKNASKQEILKAVTLAVKGKEYTAREIVEAQKELLNPYSKIAADFIYSFGLEGFKNKWVQLIELHKRLQSSENNLQKFKLLNCFDKQIEKEVKGSSN